jgi:hypothetical protein
MASGLTLGRSLQGKYRLLKASACYQHIPFSRVERLHVASIRIVLSSGIARALQEKEISDSKLGRKNVQPEDNTFLTFKVPSFAFLFSPLQHAFAQQSVLLWSAARVSKSSLYLHHSACEKNCNPPVSPTLDSLLYERAGRCDGHILFHFEKKYIRIVWWQRREFEV